MREALPAKLKLEVRLRYLATGEPFKSLEYLFRVPKSSISKFIEEVMVAVCDALKEFIKEHGEIEEFRSYRLDCLNHDRHPSRLALAKREEYCTYFNNAGAVPWQ
ncbi:hypothetical protein JTB14_007548 [Gonioctena quinquepunctata]|nr:hypothetical protein JTB14_007548 [Gonioctena quinquepunctata]